MTHQRELLQTLSSIDNMATLMFIAVLLFLTIQTTECVSCFTCTNIPDDSLCTALNITQCNTGQSCFKSTQLVNGLKTMSSGCLDNSQCPDVAGPIVGRNIYERQSLACMECCSTDMCNGNLCNAQTPTCVDDPSVDCVTMDKSFSICKDVQHANILCPLYCGLCNTVTSEWSKWSDWSHCDVTCNNGTQTRVRSCTNPQSDHGGHVDCIGNTQDVRPCYTAVECPSVPKYSDCSETKRQYPDAQDGVYEIELWKTNRTIQVYCDMTTDGGGWTVFQNRFNGSLDFNRKYSQYVHGFGDLHTEFWLGLDYVQEITSQRINELRIDLMSTNGSTAYEVLSLFSLSLPNYVLHVGNTISSNHIDLGSSDQFGTYHNGQAFSTFDKDMDSSYWMSCAAYLNAAWWYNDCYTANLNGQYLTPSDNVGVGIVYKTFILNHSLKQTRMSFRRQ